MNVPGFERFPQPRLRFVQKMPSEQFPGNLFAKLMTNAELAARRKEETSGRQRLFNGTGHFIFRRDCSCGHHVPISMGDFIVRVLGDSSENRLGIHPAVAATLSLR